MENPYCSCKLWRAGCKLTRVQAEDVGVEEDDGVAGGGEDDDDDTDLYFSPELGNVTFAR